jgi:hypothetical protein
MMKMIRAMPSDTGLRILDSSRFYNMKKDHKEQNNITTLSCCQKMLAPYTFIPIAAGV